MTSKTVVVTGGAGRIAYSLIPLLCDGKTIFNSDDKINLRLLDMPVECCINRLAGVKMEVEDCCYQSLSSVTTTTDPSVAFKNADVVIILGIYIPNIYVCYFNVII